MNEETLFAEALGKQGAARSAFLDEHCKDDAELRNRLEALLQAHDHPDPFLEVALPVGTVVDLCREAAGAVIGPYKLLEPIGEGGMGTVWMAQQTEPVKRLVALKLIKAGMDSRQVIARFEAERQALALMDHPNIAKVLDGGATRSDRPYFVMDLVKGVPITKFCDEHHLTPRQRLELFIPVCHAIQHAHQKGIIHRDLKPSNVLVALYDGKPVPKVIDFGVAKAAGQQLTDKTLVTGFGHIVGTLEYMSPEQAEINQLDIDTRSDIYSLGVLLYELLTGSPPFTRKELEKAGMLEMLRVIREKEPSKPSTKLSTAEGLPTLAANRGTEPATLTKLVRGELDWIVMKALEKDRNRRYETANGFAMDMQRYLADEPVLAGPPSAGYRVRKFARRNRGLLTVAGAVTASVVLAIGALGFSYTALAAKQKETEEAKNQVFQALKEKGKALDETERQRKALADSLRSSALLAQGHGSDLCRTGHTGPGLLWQTRALAMLPADSAALERLIRANIDAWSADMTELRGVVPRAAWVPSQFTPDGSKLIVDDGVDKLLVWSVNHQRPAYPPLMHPPRELERAIVTPDSRTLIALVRNLQPRAATIVFWDLADGQCTRETTVLNDSEWANFPDAHAISPDGKRLITPVVREKIHGELIVWDIATGKRTETISTIGVLPDRARFQSDGKTLLVISRNGTEVRRWDLDGAKWVGDPIVLERRSGTGWPEGMLPRFSASFDRVLTVNGDGNLVVRDLTTGRQLGALIPIERANRLVAFSPDGDTLITVGSDWNGRQGWIWDLAGGRNPTLLSSSARAGAEIRELVFSPDGTKVLLISPDRTAQIWNVSDRTDSPFLLQHRDEITCAAFSPDSSVVVTGAQDGQVQMWSTASREPIGVPISHDSRITGILFSPDGKHFATLDHRVFDQRYVRLWMIPDKEANRMRSYPIDTRAVDISRGRIAIGKKERTPDRAIARARAALVCDTATGKDLAGPLLNELYFEVAVFSPNGKLLAVVPRTTTNPALSEGAVNFWEVETGKLLGRGPVTKNLDYLVHPAFSPDGKLLAAGSIDGRVLVFDVPSGKLVSPADLNHNDPLRKSSWRWVRAVAFSPDGKLLATAGMDTRVCLWDTRTWEPRGVFHHPGKAMSVAFAPHGLELITGCGDGLARRWDIATGTQIGVALAEKGTIWAVAEQPAGAYRAVAKDYAIQLWDRDTSHRVGPAYPHRVATIMRLEYSKDQRTLHAWWAGGGRIIDLPRPVAGDPALIHLHTEVMTGFELLPNGETRSLDMQTWLERNAELKRSGFTIRRGRVGG